jgi:hypothetical protein
MKGNKNIERDFNKSSSNCMLLLLAGDISEAKEMYCFTYVLYERKEELSKSTNISEATPMKSLCTNCRLPSIVNSNGPIDNFIYCIIKPEYQQIIEHNKINKHIYQSHTHSTSTVSIYITFLFALVKMFRMCRGGNQKQI